MLQIAFTLLTRTRVSDFARHECQLLQHVSKFELQMEYLQRLINIISVQNLTQVGHSSTKVEPDLKERVSTEM